MPYFSRTPYSEVDADGTVTFRATDPDAETIIGELEKAGA